MQTAKNVIQIYDFNGLSDRRKTTFKFQCKGVRDMYYFKLTYNKTKLKFYYLLMPPGNSLIIPVA